jgi:ribosomal protein S27E
MCMPFDAFPSWFLRVTCDRCGKERMINQAHFEHGQLQIRRILARMWHDGCGGRPATAELLTGIEGVSSRPVRRIGLLG